MSNPNAEISPALLFNTINAYQRTATIKAAIEFDLFTLISEGSDTAQALAARCDASERGMRTLCDYLVVCGFLTKRDSRYELTPESSVFLNRNSPAYVGGITEFLLSPMLIDGFKDVAAIVRKGGTVMPEEGALAPEHPVWMQFARAMAPLMIMPAQRMAQLVGSPPNRKLKVLDIAAGHGMFGITLAQRYKNAEVVAVDWPNVLEVAKENAQRARVSDRHRTIAGSAFDVDYGSDYDLVLLTNFLHHFDPETCVKLLKKVHAALAKGGRAFTLEFVPDEDRVSPPEAAMFSLMMLGSTPGGDAYTFSELERMFSSAGFSHSELHALLPSPSSVVISDK
ncbi:MAG: methyltransferase domain-containing protein [Pyrinomonadaceae bacterium]|nr:methyltransferase domain-containing protein [Pyrinomonadaceae bacterium]